MFFPSTVSSSAFLPRSYVYVKTLETVRINWDTYRLLLFFAMRFVLCSLFGEWGGVKQNDGRSCLSTEHT